MTLFFFGYHIYSISRLKLRHRIRGPGFDQLCFTLHYISFEMRKVGSVTEGDSSINTTVKQQGGKCDATKISCHYTSVEKTPAHLNELLGNPFGYQFLPTTSFEVVREFN